MSDFPYYLDQAVERMGFGMEQVSAEWTPRPRVMPEIDVGIPPPVWWPYPGEVAISRSSTGLVEQTFVVNWRLVIGYTTEGYDNSLVRRLWRWMPDVLNFWEPRTSLILERGQDPITYLVPGSVQLRQPLPFGVLPNQTNVGVTFPIELTFRVKRSPVNGN